MPHDTNGSGGLIDACSDEPVAPPRDPAQPFECIIEYGQLGRDLEATHAYRMTEAQVTLYAGVPGRPNHLGITWRTFGQICTIAKNPDSAVYVRWEGIQEFWRVTILGHPRRR